MQIFSLIRKINYKEKKISQVILLAQLPLFQNLLGLLDEEQATKMKDEFSGKMESFIQ